MQPLENTLRNQLERTVKAARTVAEDAAEAALGQLGVGEATVFLHYPNLNATFGGDCAFMVVNWATDGTLNTKRKSLVG